MEGKQTKQKRNRAIVSCTACRWRKVKCDRKHPCGSCILRGQAHLCTKTRRENPLSAMALGALPIQSADRGSMKYFTEGQSDKRALEESMEFFPSLGGFSSYTEARSDDLINNILALQRESIAGCECVFTDKKCLLHSEAMGHFLSYLAPSMTTNHPKGTDGRREQLKELELNWTPHNSLLIPKITDEKNVERLQGIYSSLPSAEILKTLIKIYYDEINWLWIVCPREVFLPTFEAFLDLLDDSKISHMELDPAFVALLLIMCALAGFVQDTPSTILGYDVQPNEWDLFTLSLYHNCLAAMSVADWITRPTLRTIWTSVLIMDFVEIYLEDDADVRISYITIAYQQCFKLHFQAENYSKEHLRSPPYDPALAGTNALLNREVRRRLLLSVYLRFWSEFLAGTSMIGLGIPTIPLPINCNMKDLMRPKYERVHDLTYLNDSRLERPLHEPTDAFLDLYLYYHLHAVQSVHLDHEHSLTPMGHLIRVEQRLVRLFNMFERNPRHDIDMPSFDYDESIFSFLKMDPSSIQSMPHPFTTCFYFYLSTEAFYNLHRKFFEIHLRTGKYPKSAIKVIQASRQILRFEGILKGNAALKSVTHLCNLQRAIVTLFMGVLLSRTDRSQTGHSFDMEENHRAPSVQDILKPDNLRDDLGILREVAGGIEACTVLPGKLGENRALTATSTLSLLWYVVLCIQTRLDEIEPSSSSDNLPAAAEPMPLMSLDELLSLSDDIIKNSTKNLDNMGFYKSMTKIHSDFNPNLPL